MALKVEIVHSCYGKATILELELEADGVYKTWWGDKIGINFEDNAVRLDLTEAGALRSSLTGTKKDSKFRRYLVGSGNQEFTSQTSLIWSRIQ